MRVRVSSRAMQVAIVIPARDEQRSVGDVVTSARRTVPGARVIVVDDASSDGTADVASAAGAHVLRLTRHAGYAGALHAGYREAMDAPPDAVVQMDADGQHRADDLPALLAGLGPAHVVLGSRFLGPAPGYRIPPLRRAGMAACRWMATTVGGVALTDPTSGLRAMTPAAAARIARHGFPDGLTETSLLIHLHREGFRIGEVPVRMNAARSRSMHAGLSGGAHMLRISWAVMGMAARPAPAPSGAPAPAGLPEPPL